MKEIDLEKYAEEMPIAPKGRSAFAIGNMPHE